MIKNQIIPNGFLRGSIPRWEQNFKNKKNEKRIRKFQSGCNERLSIWQ